MNAPQKRPADERITRTFKSGNSVAIRIPKSWGFAPGEEVEIAAKRDGQFTIRRRRANQSLRDLFGAFSDRFMADGRGDIDQEPRDWDERS